MGKVKNNDPVVDKLAVLDAKSMLVGQLISTGWRLACTVIIPIIIGVQLDKKFDSKPSITLAAFFIALIASGLLIYRTYTDLQRRALTDFDKTKKKVNRRSHA